MAVSVAKNMGGKGAKKRWGPTESKVSTSFEVFIRGL